MKVKYFQDSDTLYIEFRAGHIVETRDFDEDALLDLDDRGRVCAMMVEHASQRTNISGCSYEEVAV